MSQQSNKINNINKDLLNLIPENSKQINKEKLIINYPKKITEKINNLEYKEIKKNNKENSLIKRKEITPLNIPINYHKTILNEKMFEKRDIVIKKPINKKRINKKLEEDINIEEIQDIVTIEYKKPKQNKKSILKKFFQYVFQ